MSLSKRKFVHIVAVTDALASDQSMRVQLVARNVELTEAERQHCEGFVDALHMYRFDLNQPPNEPPSELQESSRELARCVGGKPRWQCRSFPVAESYNSTLTNSTKLLPIVARDG